MGWILSEPPGHKGCTEEIYHNLGLRPLRHKDLIAPPGRQPTPAEVLAKEEGALQRVEEKGHNDEHFGTNCSSKQ